MSGKDLNGRNAVAPQCGSLRSDARMIGTVCRELTEAITMKRVITASTAALVVALGVAPVAAADETGFIDDIGALDYYWVGVSMWDDMTLNTG